MASMTPPVKRGQVPQRIDRAVLGAGRYRTAMFRRSSRAGQSMNAAVRFAATTAVISLVGWTLLEGSSKNPACV
jgi:hypothetical protein